MQHTASDELRRIRSQQTECDRMQAQLANGTIGLQEEHVLSRLRSQLLSAFDALDSDTQTVGEPLESAALKCIDSLQNLRSQAIKFGDLKSYGSDILVEEWSKWLQQVRTETNESLDTLRHLPDALTELASLVARARALAEGSETLSDLLADSEVEAAQSKLARIATLIEKRKSVTSIAQELSGDMLCYRGIANAIQKISASCTDAKVAWAHAEQVEWFWKHSKKPFERSLAAKQAAEARMQVRSKLSSCQSSLARATEAYRDHVKKLLSGNTTNKPAQKRKTDSLMNAVKPLGAILDAVAKIELQSKDRRLPLEQMENCTEDQNGSSAALDAKFYPFIQGIKKLEDSIYEACATSLASANSCIEVIKAAREDASERLQLSERNDKLSAELQQAEQNLSSRIRSVRQSAYLDNVNVWSNIANIRRAAERSSVYFQLASDLLETRNTYVKRPNHNEVDLPLLVDISFGIRKTLARFIELTTSGGAQAAVSGKTDTIEDRRKKRDKQTQDVLRRLQAKLDNSQSVDTQVEELTNQACSERLLARLYEGWMPFV